MELKPGLKLKTAGSPAEFIVIRAPQGDVDLTCAGAPLNADGSGVSDGSSGDEELLIGKRYAAGDLELLCTQTGAGPLLLGGAPVGMQTAKALPSSD